MSNACIKAFHEMEERYARLVLEFHNSEQRKLICTIIGDMIDERKVAPVVTVTPNKKVGGGEYSLEFHDDYDRVSGEFFEELIKKLDIDHCEI